MRRRWMVPAAVLVAGGLLAGFPAPALADTTPDLGCVRSLDARVFRLTANADYSDSPERGLRYWTRFRFMVHGGAPDQNRNNVNIRLSEYGRTVFTYNSPDSIEFNRWYTVRPSTPVRTSIYSPQKNALIEAEAIFDLRGTADPRCTAALNTK
jgi:hypothetical protein